MRLVMKAWPAIAMAAFSAACSRQPAGAVSASAVPIGSPIDGDTPSTTDGAELPLPDAALAKSDSPSVAGERGIPFIEALSEMAEPVAPRFAVVPRVLPGHEHPAGTVVVVSAGDDRAAAVEWDLATRSIVQRSALEVPVHHFQALSVGSSIRVLAYQWNEDAFFVQLNERLEVVSRQRLGLLSATGPRALAADESLTIVLCDGILDGTPTNHLPSGLYAVTFDGAGRRLGKRLLELHGDLELRSALLWSNVAVVQGRPFILLDQHGAIHLVELGRDLRTVRQRVLPMTDKERRSLQLHAVDGHLLVEPYGASEWLDVSLDLSRVTPRPRIDLNPAFPDSGADCGPAAVRLGPELVDVCKCDDDQLCLTFSPGPR